MGIVTFLFTDIVDSTELVQRVGDDRWDVLLHLYRCAVRRELRAFGGLEVDNAGDGFFALFTDPDRAVQCACALSASLTSLGLTLRSGLHTGACHTTFEKPSGINVHVAARIMASAHPGEVLASESVRRSIGSATLIDAGVRQLRGLPGEWLLYRAA